MKTMTTTNNGYMKKLNEEVLDKVNGGYWTPNTLSPEEKEELNKLVNDVNAEVACSFYALLDFLNRMNEKYGESGWNINDFV